jgi:pilus assembly protein TadC
MDEDYQRAQKRVEQLKGFYWNLIFYIIVNVFLAVINLLYSPGFWWFLFVTFFWGIAIIAQAFSIFSKRRLFSKEWEERKMKEYMEEEKE